MRFARPTGTFFRANPGPLARRRVVRPPGVGRKPLWAAFSVIAGQQLENTVENPALRPSAETLMDRFPVAETLR
jgi:hypothetical protein